MKRRNAECGKLRRPLKRSKITEGIYGSTFLYVKFLMVWALVLMADFILEFRFEYLWPFWLLVRSVYDSFKFQGLAFSVFFVCVAITSDVICYLFIPVQWLFFAASTYVWVQYVWHTERGICLPTVFLWLLFVYIEASVRLREFKSLPFHLDLCRPFAAHCIGYPVVTLGFGFKSYISYRIRVRKQKDVQKENGFYTHLLQQALPSDQQSNTDKQKGEDHQQGELSSHMRQWPVFRLLLGALTSLSGTFLSTSHAQPSLPSKAQDELSNGITPSTANSKKQGKTNTNTSTEAGAPATASEVKDTNKTHKQSSHIEDCQYIEQPPVHPRQPHNINDYDEENYKNDQHAKTFKANGVAKSTNKLNSTRDNVTSNKKSKSNNAKETQATSTHTAPFTNNKDESIPKLESDIKRLKADLQSSRNCEQELRSQINNLMHGEKCMKSEVYQLRQDNESLQTKLHNLVTSRQQDKQNLTILERKLTEERKLRSMAEQQLSQERKAKKSEEAARQAALANRVECTEACKSRRRELENEIKHIRHEIHLREDQVRQFERETQSLRQYKDVQNEKEILMSALAAVQDKNSHLENSLTSVTRLKLDLFSALGDAKRQIEIQAGLLIQKDLEITELKQKVAEVMALMPAINAPYTPTSQSSSPHFSANFTSPNNIRDEDVLAKSSLNPNASDYTPKGVAQ